MRFSSPSLTPEFSLTVRAGDAARVTTVQASGELDLAAADELAATLATQYRTAGEIRLDVSGVTFMDAPILGVLVRAHREMHARAGRLTLVGVRPRTQRLLHIAGLDGVLSAHSVAS